MLLDDINKHLIPCFCISYKSLDTDNIYKRVDGFVIFQINRIFCGKQRLISISIKKMGKFLINICNQKSPYLYLMIPVF